MEFKDLAIIGLAVLGGLVLFFSGRLRERYGKLRPSENVTRSYEQYRLDPDQHYYISGPEAYPNALIGIDRRFALAEELWKPRNFDPVTFREAVEGMQSMALSKMQALHGFEILDQHGTRIGTWYSALHSRTTIKALSDDRVRIDPPPLSGVGDGP